MYNKTTKPEIIGILFAKLKPKKDEVFADVGCGNGSVSEFFTQHVKKVYAVDIDEIAVERAKSRLEKFDNVEVINMDGIEFLKEFEYDMVFFGGTRNIGRMIEVAVEKARKIAVNAARIEVAVKVTEKMKNLGVFKEMLIANISKSYELAGGLAFKNLNPVFIIVGER